MDASDSAGALSRTRVDVGSISGKPVTLAELFSLVEFQTDLMFEYATGDLPLGAELVVQGAGAMPLGQLLTLISSQHSIEFEVHDRRLHAAMKRAPILSDGTLTSLAVANTREKSPASKTTSEPELVDRQATRRITDFSSMRTAVKAQEPGMSSDTDPSDRRSTASSPVTAAKQRRLPNAEFQDRSVADAVPPARNVAGTNGAWPSNVKNIPSFEAFRDRLPATEGGSTHLAAAALVAQLQEIAGTSGLSGATREKRISGLVRSAVSSATLDERDSAAIIETTEALVSAAVGAAPRFVDVIASSAAFTPSISRIERGTARIRAAAYAASRALKK